MQATNHGEQLKSTPTLKQDTKYAKIGALKKKLKVHVILNPMDTHS